MGIIVEWIPPAEPGIEYIDIDLDKLRNGAKPPRRMETMCTSRDGEDTEFFKVIVDVEPKNDGRIDLIVEYDKDENRELGLSRGYFGTNRIILEKEQDRGSYHWEGKDEWKFKSDKDGWRKEESYEEKFRKCHLEIERDKKFRSLILNSDKKKCVISGESTKKALEAAHIRSVADKGADERENGITLRADIHRLYDAGMFNIHPETGEPVNINPKLSKKYKKLLEQSKGLPPETLERVRKALEDVWPGDRSRV